MRNDLIKFVQYVCCFIEADIIAYILSLETIYSLQKAIVLGLVSSVLYHLNLIIFITPNTGCCRNTTERFI